MSSRCVRPKSHHWGAGGLQAPSEDQGLLKMPGKVFNDAAKSLNQVRCTYSGFDLTLASLVERTRASALIYLGLRLKSKPQLCQIGILAK